MNVSRYRHQVQFPPKMAICCLPFQGLADSVDKGFREAGHRWHPRFYKVILWVTVRVSCCCCCCTDHWCWSQILLWCREHVQLYITNTITYISLKYWNQLKRFIVLSLVSLYAIIEWVKCMKYPFRPKEYGLQDAKKWGRSRIISFYCYRVCLLLR